MRLQDGPLIDETDLTSQQQAVLAVIRDAIQRRGYPPSMREIGDATGLRSTSSVSAQLANLQRLGFLRRSPHQPRAIELNGRTTTPKPEPVDHQAELADVLADLHLMLGFHFQGHPDRCESVLAARRDHLTQLGIEPGNHILSSDREVRHA